MHWLDVRTGKQWAEHSSALTKGEYYARFGNDDFGFAMDSNSTNSKQPLEVRGLDYSPNGSYLASRDEAEISVFDSKAREIGSLTIDAKRQQRFSISPDGKWLVAGGALPYGPEGTLLWNVKTGQKIRLSEDLGNPIHFNPIQFNFSPDGRQLYGAFAQDKGLQFATWEIGGKTVAPFANAKEISFPLNRSSPLSSASLAPAGQKLAVADENFIEIRQQDGSSTKKLDGLVAGTMAMKLSSDAQFLAARTYDGAMRLWNVQTGKPLAQLNADKPVDKSKQDKNSRFVAQTNSHNMAFTPDNKLFAYAKPNGDSSVVELWSLNGKTRLLASLAQTAPVTALAFSPDNKALICGDEKGLVQCYDVPTRQVQARTNVKETVIDVVFTTSNLAVVGTSTTNLYRLPAARNPQFQRVAQLDIPIFYLHKRSSTIQWAVSPDGKLLAKTLYGVGIQIWRLPTGSVLQFLPQDDSADTWISDLAFSSDSTQLTSMRKSSDGRQMKVTTYSRIKPE